MLHDPHAELGSATCPSAVKIMAAVRKTMDFIYALCSTSFDLLYLEHSITLCWFAAGAALIRYMRAKVRDGDKAEASRVGQELGVIR